MGFRSLRVINEDRVQPARGFGTHGHRDMEIISYVLSGALQHKDSMGNGSVIKPGDVQLMSAGTGVTHSEFNGSQNELVHFMQIWIVPDAPGGTPGYQEKHFTEADRHNKLCLVAAPQGAGGALHIKQNVFLYASLLDAGATVNHTLAPGRNAWLQLARGSMQVNGVAMNAGDGLAVSSEAVLTLLAGSDSEFLLFDLN
jgi:redox-sensitive bicupin YhaK (pirin superfamily)